MIVMRFIAYFPSVRLACFHREVLSSIMSDVSTQFIALISFGDYLPENRSFICCRPLTSNAHRWTPALPRLRRPPSRCMTNTLGNYIHHLGLLLPTIELNLPFVFLVSIAQTPRDESTCNGGSCPIKALGVYIYIASQIQGDQLTDVFQTNGCEQQENTFKKSVYIYRSRKEKTIKNEIAINQHTL